MLEALLEDCASKVIEMEPLGIACDAIYYTPARFLNLAYILLDPE